MPNPGHPTGVQPDEQFIYHIPDVVQFFRVMEFYKLPGFLQYLFG